MQCDEAPQSLESSLLFIVHVVPSLRLKCVCDSVVYSYLRYIHNYVAPAAAGSSYDAKCFVHSARSLPFSLSLSLTPVYRQLPVAPYIDPSKLMLIQVCQRARKSAPTKARDREGGRQGGREESCTPGVDTGLTLVCLISRAISRSDFASLCSNR